MKPVKLIIILILCSTIAACLGSSDTDLAALQSSNDVAKRQAIVNFSKPKPFPVSLFSRRTENKAVAVLSNMLQDGHEPDDIQISIISTLGDLGRRNQVPVGPIIAKLEHQSSRIRLQAVEALGKIRNSEAVPALIQLLETDANGYAIIWALGEIGDKRAVSALNPLLASKEKYIRYQAKKALNKIQ